MSASWNYEDLCEKTKAVHRIDVPLERLRAALPEMSWSFEPGQVHRQLIRSILAVRTISEAVATIGVEHVYGQEYFPVIKSMTWPQLVAYKAETVLDIRQRGIQVPVEVFFDNAGHVYFHGFHRLSASLELGFQTIPVNAHLLTDELAELAKRLFSIYENDDQYTLYQPVQHPFFQLYPTQLANTAWDEKVRVLIEATRGWAGKVVEVGAHFGMLTRALRAAGVPIIATDLLAMYGELQPMFEAVGLAAVPYQTTGIQHLAEEEEPCRLMVMGLMHHLMGNSGLWAMMETTVLPWMTRHVPEMVVEMSLLSTYLGGTAAVAVTSDAEVEVFWNRYGFTSRRLLDGAMRRVTYHVRRRA